MEPALVCRLRGKRHDVFNYTAAQRVPRIPSPKYFQTLTNTMIKYKDLRWKPGSTTSMATCQDSLGRLLPGRRVQCRVQQVHRNEPLAKGR